MARKCYIKQDQGSFYSEYFLQLVSPNHFFHKLNQIVD